MLNNLLTKIKNKKISKEENSKAVKDSFKKVWNLRDKKIKLQKLIEEKSKRLDEVLGEISNVELDTIKVQANDYMIPLSLILEADSKFAENLIKKNKVIHKLKIDTKKYEWQKSKIEGYLVSHPDGVLLQMEPPEDKEYKKVIFIQVEDNN